jgi:hypothetical protein
MSTFASFFVAVAARDLDDRVIVEPTSGSIYGTPSSHSVVSRDCRVERNGTMAHGVGGLKTIGIASPRLHLAFGRLGHAFPGRGGRLPRGHSSVVEGFDALRRHNG